MSPNTANFVCISSVALAAGAWAWALGKTRSRRAEPDFSEAKNQPQCVPLPGIESLIETWENPAILLDAQGRILLANRAWLMTFSMSRPPELSSLRAAFPGVTFPAGLEAAWQSGAAWQDEIAVTTPAGTRHVRLRLTRFGGAGLIEASDETRVRQLEEVRSKFVSNVSHELRTPLAVFQGYVETLLDTPEMPAAQRQEIAEALLRKSTQLNSLVADLLSLARLENTREVLRKEPVSLERLVAELQADWSMRDEGQAKSAGITFELEPGVDLIRAEPLRLRQVLDNLLDNARKYTQPTGQIRLAIRRCATGIEFCVSDTGEGISAEELPHIFERFYRTDRARRREGGTGLGLAIVKHIAQRHGGTVSAMSEPGQGTTVVVRLPEE